MNDCNHKDSDGRLVFTIEDVGLTCREEIVFCDMCGEDISEEEEIQAASDAQDE